MNWRVVIRPEVETDIAEQAKHATRQVGAGMRRDKSGAGAGTVFNSSGG